MNWRISKAAATLFLSSFFFSSCEDPTTIGLELQEPGSLIGTTYADTSTINASTVLLKDSIITLGSAFTQVGSVEDGDFGTVTAKTFAEFTTTSLNVAFDPNDGADSLVLRLDYDYFYGDTTQQNTWNVHRITNGFRDDTTYFTSGGMPYAPATLGSVTFTPRPRANYYIKNTAGTDSTKNPMLINIKLNTAAGMALANEILAQSDKAPLKTQQAFIDQLLKGLAIVPAPGAENKSIIGIVPASTSSSLILYYKSKTDNTTKSYTFRTTNRYFNQIQANRSGGALAGLTAHADALPSTATGNKVFLQAGTGLVTKLTLPYLKDYRKDAAGQTRDLLINKAELVIPVNALSTTGDFPLPPVISLLRATTSNHISRTDGFPNAISGEGTGQPAILEYRSKELVYVVNVTTYLQNVLYDRLSNSGLILFPSAVGSSLATPTANAQSVNRAVLKANQTSTGADRIRLKIYYSTPQ
ncbi:MAG: DUF4270 family protein [Rufibacter sp.]